jgi:soluble lytic murein transglycosylase-like protein
VRAGIEETPAREEDRRTRIFLFAFVLAILTACLAAIGFNAEAARERPLPAIEFRWVGTAEARTAQIERFVTEWFATCSPWKRGQARALIPDVIAAAEAGNVNPALVAAIVSYESTWQPAALGKLGEVGLMQVNNWTGTPLDTPRAQLDAGIATLNHAYDVCGTVAGALSYYATGKSCAVYRGARLRIRMAAHIEAL